MNKKTYGPSDFEVLLRRYYAACNAADYEALISCFTPDGTHYFPPGLPEIPWRTPEAIARKWQWAVATLGSFWTIENIIYSHDKPVAVLEWTHWKRKLNTAQRGDEWYEFDPQTGLISEIRAYYAAPAVKAEDGLPLVNGTYMGELVGFDYAGRGYHTRADDALAPAVPLPRV